MLVSTCNHSGALVGGREHNRLPSNTPDLGCAFNAKWTRVQHSKMNSIYRCLRVKEAYWLLPLQGAAIWKPCWQIAVDRSKCLMTAATAWRGRAHNDCRSKQQLRRWRVVCSRWFITSYPWNFRSRFASLLCWSDDDVSRCSALKASEYLARHLENAIALTRNQTRHEILLLLHSTCWRESRKSVFCVFSDLSCHDSCVYWMLKAGNKQMTKQNWPYITYVPMTNIMHHENGHLIKRLNWNTFVHYSSVDLDCMG